MIKDRHIRKYFIPALTLKIIGAIFLGLVYQFYYGGGDTFGYFTNGSKHIWDAFMDAPWKGIKLLLEEGDYYHLDTFEYSSKIYYYGNPPTYLIVRISGLFGLFSFHTYAINATFFALYSFSGVWALFITFYRMHPHLHKQFAIACFFIPSLFFWGSGILKDSVTFGALGWAFYCIYQLFIVKKQLLKPIIILIISLFLLKVIKLYILICFIPTASIWIFMHYNSNIRSNATKLFLKPFFLLIAIAIGVFASYKISQDNQSYRFDKIIETSQATSSWLTTASKMNEGSYYTLGEFEMTPMGMLSKLPQAIGVTLFRPYLWESKNIVMMISAFESFFFLIFTLFVIFKTGLLNTLSIIRKDAFIIFLLLFSLTFAFAIGISTYNFGSLVRYKIPIIPFYLAAIIIIWDTGKQLRKKE